MCTNRLSYLCLTVLLLLTLSCNRSSEPPQQDGKIVDAPRQAGESIVEEETFEEIVNNCGEGGDVININPSRSVTIGESIQWTKSGSVGAGGELSAIIAGLNLNVEVTLAHNVQHFENEQIAKSINLPAEVGEKMRYTLVWKEIWQPGKVVVRHNNEESELVYRYRKSIDVRIVDKQKLDCPISSNTSSDTSNLPSIATNTPVPTKAATATAQPTKTPTYTPTAIPAISDSIIHVEGIGLAPEAQTNPAQRRRSAVLAAEVDAKRKLTEWVSGSEIDSITIVEQGVLTVDTIREVLSGKVPRHKRVEEHYDDSSGVATVILELVISAD